MKKNTLRTLWLSLTVMLIFCIIVFTGLANYTVTQSDRAIGEVGEIYMDQMGTQVKMHFTTMIELQESRMNGIIWSTPQQSAAEDPEQAWAHLASMASQTGFHFLSLYSAGGACDTIFGEPVEIGDPASFMDSLAQGELHVTDGTLPSGERLLLLGAAPFTPCGAAGPVPSWWWAFPWRPSQKSSPWTSASLRPTPISFEGTAALCCGRRTLRGTPILSVF